MRSAGGFVRGYRCDPLSFFFLFLKKIVQNPPNFILFMCGVLKLLKSDILIPLFLFFFFIARHPFIILLFCVRNGYVVAYEIKIHLDRLHCSVSYANVLSFCFHAPDSHNVVAT